MYITVHWLRSLLLLCWVMAWTQNWDWVCSVEGGKTFQYHTFIQKSLRSTTALKLLYCTCTRKGFVWSEEVLLKGLWIQKVQIEISFAAHFALTKGFYWFIFLIKKNPKKFSCLLDNCNPQQISSAERPEYKNDD